MRALLLHILPLKHGSALDIDYPAVDVKHGILFCFTGSYFLARFFLFSFFPFCFSFFFSVAIANLL